MSGNCVALHGWETGGGWTKPRSRRRLDALVVAGLLLWGLLAFATEGNAISIGDGLPYDLASLNRIDPVTLLTCTGGKFCQSGTDFAQSLHGTITLPNELAAPNLLLVFAGVFGGSSPPTCDLNGFQKLNASIRPGSVFGAMLVEVHSPAGSGTPLCDSYGQTLQALLLEGGPGEKLEIDFIVDVTSASPEVSQLVMPRAGFALVPEPDSISLLAMGLLLLRAGARSPLGRRA